MLHRLEESPAPLAQQTITAGDEDGRKERVVQVVIVETHHLLREGLQQVLRGLPRVQIAACLRQIQDIPEIIKSGDVLLLGSSIGACDCLECIRLVRETQAPPGIVIIQQQLRPETAFPLIKSGAQGLLGEDASSKDLAWAIMAAAAGNTFLDLRAREILNEHVSHVPLHFTKREMQVLPLLKSGLSNVCIAQQLSLKEKTVEKHLTHIYEKLQIRSRTEAMVRIQALHI